MHECYACTVQASTLDYITTLFVVQTDLMTQQKCCEELNAFPHLNVQTVQLRDLWIRPDWQRGPPPWCRRLWTRFSPPHHPVLKTASTRSSVIVMHRHGSST